MGRKEESKKENREGGMRGQEGRREERKKGRRKKTRILESYNFNKCSIKSFFTLLFPGVGSFLN